MAPDVKTYDLAKHTFVFGEILGGASGPEGGITVKRSGKVFSTTVGVDGSGARSRMNDKSGTVELELLQTDPMNDLLSSALAEDELLGTGIRPLEVLDLNGTSVEFAQAAWIEGWPDQERAKEVGTVKWVFATAQLDRFIGGGLL